MTNESKTTVMLSHPGKHYHFYQIALAANQAGMLGKFITASYYLPERFPYRLFKVLPPSLIKTTIDRLKARRTMPGLDEQLVDSMPYYEWAALLGDRVPIVRDIIGRTNLLLIKNALYDRSVARRIEREQCNIVHCLSGCARSTFKKAKQLGATTVLDVIINPFSYKHTDQEYQPRRQRQVELMRREREEFELADYVFSPSDFVSDGVAATGFPRDRIIHIPYGVQTDRFTERKDRVDDSFRILFVGQVALRKGFQYLLEAFKGLDLPKAELTIIGSPVDSVSEKVLRSYDGLFTWVPNVSYDKLHHCYQNSDVFVFPSLAEGSALVTYEALACGLPSIVTENAGSVVRENIEGFVVPIRDPLAIREKLRQLYHDRALLSRMSQAARVRAEDFTWMRYHERIVDAYAKIENARIGRPQ